jgi:hypothetical protein
MMIHVFACAECSVAEMAAADSVRCGIGISFFPHSRRPYGSLRQKKSSEEIDMLFETKDD